MDQTQIEVCSLKKKKERTQSIDEKKINKYFSVI